MQTQQHSDNIARFLELQAKDDGAMIMLAHQHSVSSDVDGNIARFLELQAKDDGAMIMLAHQHGLG